MYIIYCSYIFYCLYFIGLSNYNSEFTRLYDRQNIQLPQLNLPLLPTVDISSVLLELITVFSQQFHNSITKPAFYRY